jgi:hypothetical protein
VVGAGVVEAEVAEVAADGNTDNDFFFPQARRGSYPRRAYFLRHTV